VFDFVEFECHLFATFFFVHFCDRFDIKSIAYKSSIFSLVIPKFANKGLCRASPIQMLFFFFGLCQCSFIGSSKMNKAFRGSFAGLRPSGPFLVFQGDALLP
jgi:hypothetical protein